jgi:acyl dehydratase
LHERITIIEKRRSSKPGRGIIKDRVEVINDRKGVVLSIEATVLLATRSPGE